jgi:hypothetical protein
VKILNKLLIVTSMMTFTACSLGAQGPSRDRQSKEIKNSPISGNKNLDGEPGNLDNEVKKGPTGDQPQPTNNPGPSGTPADSAQPPQQPAGGPAPGDQPDNQNKNSPPELPAPPPPTHKLTVDCNQALNIRFEFGGRVEPFRMAGGLINGQPTELVTAHCPKIRTALDKKGFPLAQKPPSKPTGGDGLSASCSSTTLRLSYVTGNPDAGTGIALAQGVDIESSDICLEIRNIINGLLLKKGALPATLR